MLDPFRIMVYDRALAPLYSLPLAAAPYMPGVQSVKVTPRLGELGSATIVVALDHLRARDLHEHGRRVRIWDRWGQHLMSGFITEVTGERGASTRGTSTVTLTVEDDARLLWRVLAWVNPLAGIDAQQSDNSDAVYRLTNQPAETIVKRVMRENAVTRLGLPLNIPADQGRGGSYTFTARMQTVAERIYPQTTQAGLAVYIRQEDNGSPRAQRVTLDVSTFTTHPQILDEHSPQVTDWTYSVVGPDAIRGVAGGQGQGDARVFKASVMQGEINGWSALYAGEFFDDQRQESNPASVQTALDAALLEKSARAQIALTLTETDSWSYGKSWRVGDFIKTRIVPGAGVLTTQITGAELAWTPKDGYSATTQVGSIGKTPQAQVIKALAARVRALQTNR